MEHAPEDTAGGLPRVPRPELILLPGHVRSCREEISTSRPSSRRPGVLVATRSGGQPMLRTARAVGYPVQRDPVPVVPDDLLAAKFTSPMARG